MVLSRPCGECLPEKTVISELMGSLAGLKAAAKSNSWKGSTHPQDVQIKRHRNQPSYEEYQDPVKDKDLPASRHKVQHLLAWSARNSISESMDSR